MAFGFAVVVLDGSSTLAAVRDGRVYPVPALVDGGPSTLDAALADWDRWVELVERALDEPAAAGHATDAQRVRYRPPAVSRPAVWCAGANYADHVAEMGASAPDKRSYHFLSPPTALAGHGDPVQRPTGATQLDWEVELAVMIGREGRNIPTDSAFAHVAGYTVANDVSVRDADRVRHPIFGLDWTAAKNGDGLTPIGPSVVPARFVPDPADLELTLTVNGQQRQCSHTSRMIVDIAEQIAALSALVTLRPGDLVLTGTPSGTAARHGGAYLVEGDVMEAAIAGLGSLRNTVA